MPVNYPPEAPVETPGDTQEKTKPSQAEGERNQPGEDAQEEREMPQPAKPSQAEGERKEYH